MAGKPNEYNTNTFIQYDDMVEPTSAFMTFMNDPVIQEIIHVRGNNLPGLNFRCVGEYILSIHFTTITTTTYLSCLSYLSYFCIICIVIMMTVLNVVVETYASMVMAMWQVK